MSEVLPGVVAVGEQKKGHYMAVLDVDGRRVWQGLVARSKDEAQKDAIAAAKSWGQGGRVVGVAGKNL